MRVYIYQQSKTHFPERKQEEPGRKKNPKNIADTKTKLNFPPFQHYKFVLESLTLYLIYNITLNHINNLRYI